MNEIFFDNVCFSIFTNNSQLTIDEMENFCLSQNSTLAHLLPMKVDLILELLGFIAYYTLKDNFQLLHKLFYSMFFYFYLSN